MGDHLDRQYLSGRHACDRRGASRRPPMQLWLAHHDAPVKVKALAVEHGVSVGTARSALALLGQLGVVAVRALHIVCRSRRRPQGQQPLDAIGLRASLDRRLLPHVQPGRDEGPPRYQGPLTRQTPSGMTCAHAAVRCIRQLFTLDDLASSALEY